MFQCFRCIHLEEFYQKCTRQEDIYKTHISVSSHMCNVMLTISATRDTERRKKNLGQRWWQLIPVKTQDWVVMWHWITSTCRRGRSIISSLISGRCISLPVPIISWNMLIWTRAILPPTFIAPPVFISLSIEYTLHAPYTLLYKSMASSHHTGTCVHIDKK